MRGRRFYFVDYMYEFKAKEEHEEIIFNHNNEATELK